jgi:hypothetical protein
MLGDGLDRDNDVEEEVILLAGSALIGRSSFWTKIRSKGFAADVRRQGRHMVSKAGRVASWALGVAVGIAAVEACAQSNLDAGKSPAQIFSDTCNACHRSPRELKPSSAGFLREHYTTGGREAAAMATYLASVGSDPRAVQTRKPPVLGAGKEKETPPPSETASKPAQSQAPQPPQTVPPGLQPPQTVPPGVAEQAKPPETQAALPPTQQGRRPPADQAKPSLAAAPAPAVAGRPRRPSESLEAGRLPATNGGAEAFSTQAVAAPSTRPVPLEEFEE